MVERIIREHSADVTRFLASRLYTPDRHEDALDCCSRAAQIFCEKYIEGLITPEDDANTLVGYFYNCAKNVAREENARYFRRQRLVDENLREISENLFQDKDYIADVLDAVESIFGFIEDHLDDREIRILRLHYCEGLTFREIAGELGLTDANVRKINQRSLEKIRDLFHRLRGPDGPGSGRRPIEGKRSSSSRFVTEILPHPLSDRLKPSSQNNFDIPLSLVVEFVISYGSICRDLDLMMLSSGSLNRQTVKPDIDSDDFGNNIEIVFIILCFVVSSYQGWSRPYLH